MRTPSEACCLGILQPAKAYSVASGTCVLGAMGIITEQARGAVRLSLGTPTTDEEIGRAAKALVSAWQEGTKHR